MLSFTVHGIDEDFNRVDMKLGMNHFSGSHTANLVYAKIVEILNGWDIPHKSVFIFFRDRGSNMIKAFEDKDINVALFVSADCGQHLLHCAMGEALKVRGIERVIAHCKDIVAHYKHSNKAKELYKGIQLELELPVHSLLQVSYNCCTNS